jgi:DNA invertase Pin-like site-specific DNA recombinase
MARMFGYVRVSTDDQGNSAQAQTDKIKQYAEREGLELCHIYVDEDVTGKKPLRERPHGKVLWDAMEDGDSVAFCKVDRVFRSMRDAADTIHCWQQRGIRAVILDLGIDLGTPAGRMFFHQLASFAEFEREMISARVREIKAYLAANERPHGNRPFGWMRDRPGKGARFVPCQPERDLAERVCSLLDAGESVRDVWLRLYKEGVTKPGRKVSERRKGVYYRLADIPALAIAARRGYPIVARDSLRAAEKQPQRSAS